MTLLAFILGMTDLILLATILEYGHRIADLEDIDNPKKWKEQDHWNKYVSKKINLMFKKLGMFPYDGSYIYNEALENDLDLNPPREPLPIERDTSGTP